MDGRVRRRVIGKTFLAVVLGALAFCAPVANGEVRIVGGGDAAPGSWQSQFALLRAGQPADRGQFCGGTLIGRRWILTAAHCLYNYQRPGAVTLPRQVDVVFARDLRQEEERLDVSRVIVHPGWIDGRRKKRADLALLQTKEPSLQPPLTMSSGKNYRGQLAQVAGWGVLNIAWMPQPMILQETSLRVFSDHFCRRVYRRAFYSPNEICAGDRRGGRDSCWGDSGGPLVSEGRLIGVVSWGGTAKGYPLNSCGSASYPGVYAAVFPQRGWITKYINGIFGEDRL